MRYRHLLPVLVGAIIPLLTSSTSTAAPDDSVNMTSQVPHAHPVVVRAPTVNGPPTALFPLVSGHDAFPSLVQLPGGAIHLAYRHGSDHYLARDGALMVSKANSSTTPFGTPQVLRDTPGVDERDPSLSYAQGEVWTTWFTGSASLAAEGAWSQRGDSTPVRIDRLPYAAIAAPVRELPDGSVGAVYYGRPAGAARDSIWFARSVDGGRAWTNRLIADGQVAGTDFQEPWLVVRGSQLLVTHRYGSWDSVGITASVDNGATWTAPRRVASSATGRPNALVLSSGTIVVTYRHVTTHDAMLISSRDGGATWAPPRLLAAVPAGPLGWTYGDLLEPQGQPGLMLGVIAIENPDGTSSLFRFWISESTWA